MESLSQEPLDNNPDSSGDIQESNNCHNITTHKFSSLLLKCAEAIKYEELCHEIIKSTIFLENISNDHAMNTPHALVAERNLLNLASYPFCVDGILYTIPLILEVNGELMLYLRCIETGIFHGFFRSNWRVLFMDLVERYNIKNCIVVNVYNDWDILAAQSYRMGSPNAMKPVNNSKMFKKLITTNKGSIINTIPIAYATYRKQFGQYAPGYVVYCQRMARYFKESGNADRRYFKVEGIGDHTTWEHTIKNFIFEKPNIARLDIECIAQEYGNEEELDLHKQFIVLSTCPNFHRWIAKKNHGVKMHEHFLSCGKSPRNQIMNAILSIQYEQGDLDVINSIQDFLKSILNLVLNQKYHLDVAPTLLVKRTKSKKAAPKIQLQSKDLLDHLGLTTEEFEKMQKENEMMESIYETFKNTLLSDGTILWRLRTDAKQVVIMNDYHSEKGYFKFNDYVTVTSIDDNNGNSNLSCTCDSYKVLMATVQATYEQNEWDGISCCHCRMLTEILSEFPINGNQTDHAYQTSTSILPSKKEVASKIDDGMKAVCMSVVPLRSSNKYVEKFSVRSSSGGVEFVHLFKSNVNNDIFVNCCSGLCQTHFSKKRKLINFFGSQDICEHLEAFRQYALENKTKHQLLNGGSESNPMHEDNNDDDNSDDDHSDDDHRDVDFNEVNEYLVNDAEDNNSEEQPSQVVNGFNPDTGMWLFHSPYGRNVSADSKNAQLQENCKRRLHWCSQAMHDESFIQCFYPKCESELCECKLEWRKTVDGEFLFEFDTATTLYTKTSALTGHVYKMVCVNRRCVIRWDGASENIFRISSMVCVGEELCWLFVHMICHTKCNFSAFCTIMNVSYEQYQSPKSFMSSKTFLKLFFSWASHQNIDFRSSCHWCGNSPKVLACDATKIGICQRNCSIDPVERTSNENALHTPTRRFDRCFLSYPAQGSVESSNRKDRERAIRESRTHLKYLAETMFHRSTEGNLTPQQLFHRNQTLIDIFPSYSKELLRRFISQELTYDQLQSTARLFYLLSFDASLQSFLPLALLPSLEKVITGENIQTDVAEFTARCRQYNPCLGLFTSTFFDGHSIDANALSCLNGIFSRVKDLHDLNVPPEIACPIEGSYNPSKLGRAYYFGRTGQQIRHSRKFDIDMKSTSSFDDVATTSSCSKRYPMISKKGSTFLFLWFCPMHGHCYGCHIVNGSEGRKDPACSLYTHLEEAPEVIFYDFSCNLEEYCLNRESGYFKNTRFFHDIFHGFSHNCSSNFSSKGLNGLQSVNTSICEQFNSYLQCIKATSKQMSQEHFMFFVQYMIHLWNEKKTVAFNKKLHLALEASK